MGRPIDPAYWQKYRASHPEYRERERQRRLARRARMTPEERKADRGVRKPKPVCHDELPMLMPHLMHGKSVSFWEDELRLDLAQEEQLALLEGRDPCIAVSEYRRRELSWRAMACPFLRDPIHNE